MADYPRRRQLLDQLMQDLISNKPAPLSPAAQAVMDAFWKDLDFREDFTPRNIAAALRALAVRINGADAIRQDVLDIAAELERQ
jgi:hypothetical protein